MRVTRKTTGGGIGAPGSCDTFSAISLQAAMSAPLIIITTILTIATLYAPQPLLPLFSSLFSTDSSHAALLLTVTFVPLSLAPLSYGYFLGNFSTVRLLRISLLALSISVLVFGLSSSFPLLLVMRFVQGLVIPAVLTSLMTYIAETAKRGQLQRLMSWYIASTITGGLLGRLLSGLSASYLGWRFFFLVLACALFICFTFLTRTSSRTTASTEKPDPKVIINIIRDPGFLFIYLIIFCTFFVFASIMNFVPFRLTEIYGSPSELLSGLIYTGYISGIGTALFSTRIITFFKSPSRSVTIGLSVFLAALGIMFLPSVGLLFVTMFIFCGAMFLVHTVCAGMANKRARKAKGMVNGLYVSFYYGGAVMGSYLPGLIYESYGWNFYLMTLITVSCIGLALSFSLKKKTDNGNGSNMNRVVGKLLNCG